MSARVKLNELFFAGSFVFAALVGLSLDSFFAFLIVALVLSAYFVSSGDIRSSGR